MDPGSGAWAPQVAYPPVALRIAKHWQQAASGTRRKHYACGSVKKKVDNTNQAWLSF